MNDDEIKSLNINTVSIEIPKLTKKANEQKPLAIF